MKFEWINLNEKTPDFNEIVICAIKETSEDSSCSWGEIDIAEYTCGIFIKKENRDKMNMNPTIIRNVTHWAKLPNHPDF